MLDVCFVWALWTDDTDSSTLGGSSMTARAHPAALSPFAVFTADPNDYRYTTSRSHQVSSGEWKWATQGQDAPRSRVMAVSLSPSQTGHAVRRILGEEFPQHSGIVIDDQHPKLTAKLRFVATRRIE